MNPRGGIMGALLAATINIRNILIVSVAADQRYGPIYNQGTAQIIHNSLLCYGYQPGMPVTLIGYSGGGQMAVGAAPYLRRSLKAPIELISLSGVDQRQSQCFAARASLSLGGRQGFDREDRLGNVS